MGFHKEKVELYKKGVKRVTFRAKRKLEKILVDFGWKKLRWCPCHEQDGDGDYPGLKLYGCPPNYKGPYCDWEEYAIGILEDPKNHFNHTGEIKVRNVLDRPCEVY